MLLQEALPHGRQGIRKKTLARKHHEGCQARALDSVGTCQNTHFCICHAAATVIVRMQGNNDIFTIFHMFAHIFNLARIHMRHCQLYGYWKVDDAFVIRSRFPHIQYGIANLKSIFRLCSGKALRAVFKLEIAFRFFSKLF